LFVSSTLKGFGRLGKNSSVAAIGEPMVWTV
jgi:hypothetical protein